MKKDEKEIRLTIKKRLKSIRGKEMQEVFVKRVLGDSDRGRWANWESTSKTNIGRLPQLEDFAIICENADVSADYLIGRDHININDSKLISNVLPISEGGVIELRKNKSITINEQNKKNCTMNLRY